MTAIGALARLLIAGMPLGRILLVMELYLAMARPVDTKKLKVKAVPVTKEASLKVFHAFKVFL